MVAAAHVGLVALLFLLTSPGQLTNSDSRVYLAQAESLWFGEWLDITRRKVEAGNMGLASWAEDRWGIVRGIYPPGTAIALGPGVLMGRLVLLATGWDRASVVLPSAWLCLLMGGGYWLLFRALARSCSNPRTAAAAALAVFLGDRGVWFVRGQIFSENLLAPALALVLWLEADARERPTGARAFALGSALGALPWIHAQLWPVAAVLSAAWGLAGLRGVQDPTGPPPGRPGALRRLAAAFRGPDALVLAGAAWPAGLLLIYNWVLFGAPLAGGYGGILDEWLRRSPAALPFVAGAIRYHWPAVLGACGMMFSLLRPAGAVRGSRPTVRWALAAAVALHAVLVCFWQLRQENQLKRFQIVESLLLAPELARLFGRLGARAARAPELLSAALVGSAFVAMLLDGMFIARVEVAGELVAVPRVWWVVLGLTRSPLGWVLGGLVAAGACASGYLAWRMFGAAAHSGDAT